MHADEEAGRKVGFIIETPSGWPSNAAAAGQGLLRVAFHATAQTGEAPAAAIVRTVEIGGVALVAATVWTATYEAPAEAGGRCDWLAAHEGRCVELGRAAAVFGSGYVTSAIEAGVRVEEADHEQRRRQDEERARIAREAAEEDQREALVIYCYFKEREGRFVIELWRGNTDKRFWSLDFDENWERDRFWDWFGWQESRWPDFAAFLAAHEEIDLDHMLLKEMLETERRVKKDGLGAGGRRPLRFWRGDA